MGTACLDPDGNVLWRNNDLHYAPVHGNGGTPVLVDGALIFSCDGSDKRFVVALDCRDGHVLWKKDRTEHPEKGFSFGTPLVIEVAGRKQVVSTGSNVVAAYDPKTGEEIWRVRYEGYSVVPRPVYGDGLVFLSTGFDSPKLLAIRPDGTGDVTDSHVAWTSNKNAPNSPSPLLLGDELYMVSDGGILTCLDAKTGDGTLARAHRRPILGLADRRRRQALFSERRGPRRGRASGQGQVPVSGQKPPE